MEYKTMTERLKSLNVTPLQERSRLMQNLNVCALKALSSSRNRDYIILENAAKCVDLLFEELYGSEMEE